MFPAVRRVAANSLKTNEKGDVGKNLSRLLYNNGREVWR
jgi:hypothetical protein